MKPPPADHLPTAGRVVRSVGAVVVVAGVLFLVAAAVVADPGRRQEMAGIGLAVIMTGLMVLLLGNYLRHAVEREIDPDGVFATKSAPPVIGNGSRDGAVLPPDDPNAQGKK